jgi:hypothetical protein
MRLLIFMLLFSKPLRLRRKIFIPCGAAAMAMLNSYIFVLLLGWTSCQRSMVECGIPEEQLVVVLADMHLAEAAAQNLSGALKDSTLQTYYRQIFTIRQVDEEGFRNCFEVLQEDPERLNLLYEKVLEEISRQKAQAEQ